MSLEIAWINHASFRLAGASVVYIDPWKIPDSPRDGDVVFVSHSHYDHCSGEDIAKVLAEGGDIVGSLDAIEQIGRGKALSPGEKVQIGGVTISAVPAYNVGKDFHPKANNWLGAIIEMDGKIIYYAGDTDQIEEMSGLSGIDLALLPVGGTYTLDAAEAAEAVRTIGPAAAIPYHFGDIVGSSADAEKFAAAAPCKVHVLAPGESITI